MEVTNSRNPEPVNPLTNFVEQSKVRMKEVEQEKERLKQKILYEWDQTGSLIFWNQCFMNVPFNIIKEVYYNIIGIMKDGYEVRSPAAFFVNTLKKTGYYPFKKEVKREQNRKV